jgi:hypothetical protein
VYPVLVPLVLILALPGAVPWPAAIGVTAAFEAVTLASLSSLAPAWPLGVVPTSSSHVVLLIVRLSTITVPYRDSA